MTIRQIRRAFERDRIDEAEKLTLRLEDYLKGLSQMIRKERDSDNPISLRMTLGKVADALEATLR